MSRKIARSLAVIAVAGAPFVAMSAPAAYATNGCSVNNAATTSYTEIEVTVAPLQDPPATATIDSTSLNCSYVTAGGRINWTCTLFVGRCQVFENATLRANCIAIAATSCTSHFTAAAGSVMTLVVTGGSGAISDAPA